MAARVSRARRGSVEAVRQRYDQIRKPRHEEVFHDS
jgi:hypothetical protein